MDALTSRMRTAGRTRPAAGAACRRLRLRRPLAPVDVYVMRLNINIVSAASPRQDGGNYVIRRFDGSAAGLNGSWGWTFAETPHYAISRIYWSHELADRGRGFRAHLVRMEPGPEAVWGIQGRPKLMNTNRSVCLILLFCALLSAAPCSGEYLGPVPYLSREAPSLMGADGVTFSTYAGLYDSNSRSYSAPKNDSGGFIYNGGSFFGWRALAKGGRFALYSDDPSTGTGDSKLFRWDRVTRSIVAVSAASDGTFLATDAAGAAISEDGTTAAFISITGPFGGANLAIWRAGEGAQHKTPVTINGLQARYIGSVAMTPDGATIVFTCELLNPETSEGTGALVRYRRSSNEFTVIRSAEGYRNVDNVSVSDDGRWVSFHAWAPLIPADTNDVGDIYALDTATDTLRRVSVHSSGTQGNGPSGPSVQISGSGRYVVYESEATNLAVDFNAAKDVFRHDLTTGATRKISVLNDGSSIVGGAGLYNEGFGHPKCVSTDGSRILLSYNGFDTAVWDENGVLPTAPAPRSRQPGLSGGTLLRLSEPLGDSRQGISKVLRDSRFVVVTSRSPSQRRTALHDTSTNTYEFVDVPTGTATILPVTSATRYVVFATDAALVEGDTNGAADIHLRDRETKQTTKLTQAYDGTQAFGGIESLSVSDNLEWVAFISEDISLAPDLNGSPQLFLLHVPTRALTLATRASTGNAVTGYTRDAKISADSRYVAFTSDASDLVQTDDNPGDDVFRYERETGKIERVSTGGAGINFDSRNVFDPAISGDGSVVAFSTDATNVVPGEDPNAVPDYQTDGFTSAIAHRPRVGGFEAFLYDFKTRTFEVASVNTAGERPIVGSGGSPYISIQGAASLNFDGSRVAFHSDARDLVAYDPEFSTYSVFLRDRTARKTTVVSYATGHYNGGVYPALDNTGNRVFFIEGTSHRTDAVFVRDTAPVPVVSSPLSITATVDRPFTYQIVASASPTSYTATSLPAGLTLNSSLGVITGTASQSGTTEVTIGATNASSTTTATLTITVQAAPASGPVITTGTAVTARAGQPFSFQVRLSGVTSAATISATGLPEGLTINTSTGVVSGTAARPGSDAVTLTVTDGSASTTGTLQLTVTEDPAAPVITSGTAANIQPGTSFTYTITAPSNADPALDPTTYALVGTLPEGLVFDPNTGTISGTLSDAPAWARRDNASINALTDPANSVLGTVQIFARNSQGTATTSLTFLIGKATAAVNIATRMAVGTGENVLIGGFIVTGTAPKKVMVRAIGPSLSSAGVAVPGRLLDPVLELRGSDGSLIFSNDDWRSTQQQAVIDSTIPPSDNRESAIIATLQPSNYTAIMSGKNNTTGIGLVEVYDLDSPATSQVAQISTRGFVQTGDDVMIGGFILSGGSGTSVLVRGIGPSLRSAGIGAALANPTLELYNANGDIIGQNDDWKSTQEQEIRDTTVPPADDREAAIVSSVIAGTYTAILRGKDNSTGVALVEIFVLQ